MSELPPWVPTIPPETWTLTKVVNHVKTGMMIELYTIPLYLYAYHSIKDEGAGSNARSSIKGIFVQEMLHLALSGNLLCALDGSMDLYDCSVIPRFPGHILFDSEKVEMNLDRANKANLDLFVRVEAPYTPRSFNATPEADLIPKYKSIGEFYDSLKEGLEILSEDAFKYNEDYQFSNSDFNGFDNGDMATINDRKTALDKMELIITQGEGGPDQKNSHFDIFKGLAENSNTWELYNVRKNPKTSDYKGLGDSKRFAYKLSLAVDATYCYLLQSIQRVWGRGGNVKPLHDLLVKNIGHLMGVVLTPLANLLVLQKLTSDSDYVAAPCFNYYPLNEDGDPLPPLEPDNLHPRLVKLVKDAADAAPDDDSKKNLLDIASEIETGMKPRP